MNWLQVYKDEIASASAIVATVAILWGSSQVYLGRKALEAEALAASLLSARQLAQTTLDRADVAARVQGVDVNAVEDSAFIAMVIGIYSSHFYLTQTKVLPKEYWENYRGEFCTFVLREKVELQLSKNIATNAYPLDFRDEILACVPETTPTSPAPASSVPIQ